MGREGKNGECTYATSNLIVCSVPALSIGGESCVGDESEVSAVRGSRV